MAQVNFHFEEASVRCGILPYTMAPGLGAGCAASDFDNDGFIDLFVPNDFSPDQLYRNLGDGTQIAFVNLAGNQIVEVVLGDLNASGVVNGLDLAMLLANWG